MERANKNRMLRLLVCMAACFCLIACAGVPQSEYAFASTVAENVASNSTASESDVIDSEVAASTEDESLAAPNIADTGTTQVTITQQLPESENIEQTVDVIADEEASGADAGSGSGSAGGSMAKTGDIANFLAKALSILACACFGLLSVFVIRDELERRKSLKEVQDAECSGAKTQDA